MFPILFDLDIQILFEIWKINRSTRYIVLTSKFTNERED